MAQAICNSRMAVMALLHLLLAFCVAQDYNVSLSQGCFPTGSIPFDIHGCVFYAVCNADPKGNAKNNWMDLNMCLSLSDDHKTIIAHENPERTNNFWAQNKCNACSLDPDNHAIIHCACYQPDGDYYTSLQFDLNTLLLDFNGSLFCFDHRASRLKIKPSAPPRRSIPEPTSAMEGE